MVIYYLTIVSCNNNNCNLNSKNHNGSIFEDINLEMTLFFVLNKFKGD